MKWRLGVLAAELGGFDGGARVSGVAVVWQECEWHSRLFRARGRRAVRNCGQGFERELWVVPWQVRGRCVWERGGCEGGGEVAEPW